MKIQKRNQCLGPYHQGRGQSNRQRFGIGSVECFMRGFKGTFLTNTHAYYSWGVTVMKMLGGSGTVCAEDETDGDKRGKKHKP